MEILQAICGRNWLVGEMEQVEKNRGFNIQKAVASVMLITVIAKLLGFAREIFLSYFLGATGVSDAYLIAQTIPGTIFQFVGTGLSTCFIPVYAGIMAKKSRKEGNYFTNSVIVLVLLFSTAVVALVWLKGDWVVRIFASGFTGETLEQAILFTKISVTSLYISTFIYVFNSFLQANDCFTPTALAAIPNSLIVLLSIFLGAKVNILFLPIGTVVAIFSQLLVLIPAVKKNQFKLHLNIDLRSQDMRTMYRMIVPVIISVSVNEINVLVDRTIASRVAVGGISALTYANSLIMFVQGIFGQTIATVYYPSIAKLAKKKDTQEFRKTVSEAVSGMMLFLIPITIGCLLLVSEIVSVLYGRGAFDADAVSMTSLALFGYAIGIIGYGIREILSRVFYSLDNTRTPTRNAMIGMAINIILNITLSRMIGIVGLALATSISSIVTSVLLLWELKSKDIYTIEKKQWISFLKMLLAACSMGVIIWLLKNPLMSLNQIAGLVLLICVGVVSYFVLCYMFRLEILRGVTAQVKGRIKRKK